MITSKITSKSQTTIPPAVREILHVGPGDELVYEVEGDRVLLRRRSPATAELAALDRLLVEWSDPANDVYDDL
jgi:antitoxin PrlF